MLNEIIINYIKIVRRKDMGRIDKGVKCTVIGCETTAVRSISMEKVESSGIKTEGDKKAYLCDMHYKEFKKKSKTSRQVDRWRWTD